MQLVEPLERSSGRRDLQDQPQYGLRGKCCHARTRTEANRSIGTATALISLQGAMLFAKRRPLSRWGGAEHTNGRYPEPRSKMHGSGVPADEQPRSLQYRQEGRQVREHGKRGHARKLFPQVLEQGALPGADSGREHQFLSGGGGPAMKLGPMRQRPFLLGLAGGQVAKDRWARKELFGSFDQPGIGVNLKAGAIGCGNSPGRQELEIG